MICPSRSKFLVVVGIAVLAVGFFLLLNPLNFGEIRLPDGNRMAANEGCYRFLGQVLICAGATLSVLSAVVWSLEGARSHPPLE